MLLLALLLQAGPLVSPGAAPAINPAELPRPTGSRRDAQTQQAQPPEETTITQLEACLMSINSDTEATLPVAEKWWKTAKVTQRAEAGECYGEALAGDEQWAEADKIFLAAREFAAADDFIRRARLAAMAGNALMADTDVETVFQSLEKALSNLDLAAADAVRSGQNPLIAEIQMDRARVLLHLKRLSNAVHAIKEAETALSIARSTAPNNPEVWLLSATLARREGQLQQAQTYIERAADLLPIDPRIGLEAGVIAMRDGREASAIKSWESVIAVDPDGDAGHMADLYLLQVRGETPTSRPTETGR